MSNDIEMMAKFRNIIQLQELSLPSLPALKGIGSAIGNVGKKIAQSYKALPTAGKVGVGIGAGMVGAGLGMEGEPSKPQSAQPVTPPSVQNTKRAQTPTTAKGLSDMEEMELNVLSVDMEKALDQPGVKAQLERYYKYHPDVKRAF